MTKILRITGVIAAALTVVFVLAFPVAFGARSDESIEEFLKAPGIIAEFKKAEGRKAAKTDSQISPLVKQAADFALYLNPPPKPKRPAKSAQAKPKIAPRPKGQVASKFKLIGTSFYQAHPDLSLALIDEPAKGLRWLRQSSTVGHLIIEQVKDGIIVIRDGQRTYELQAERKPKKSLVRGKGLSLGETTPKSILAGKPESSEPSLSGAEGIARTEEFMENVMKDMQAMAGPDEGDSQRTAEDSEAAMKEILSALETMRMRAEESQKLNNLGQELKDTKQNPNPVKNPRSRRQRIRRRTTPGSKIQTQSSDPNSPE